MQAGGLRVAAVSGCAGVERSRFAFRGQAAHAGTTPIDSRRDAGLAAAEAALAIERLAVDEGGVATTGELRLEPGFATAVPGRATLSVDLRHAQAPGLARMLARTREACKEVAAARGCELAETQVWRIEPIRFDPGLVATARAVCATVAGDDAELASGALHDAAEVARVLPAAMLFAPSRGGISHAPEEDTDEADLALAIEALGELAGRVLVGGRLRRMIAVCGIFRQALTVSTQDQHICPTSGLAWAAPNRGSPDPRAEDPNWDSGFPGGESADLEP